MEDNIPDLNQNTPYFLDFLASTNLLILNSLPMSSGGFTHFMERAGFPPSKSVLDYGLVSGEHQSFITSFCIDENARFDCGTDHALLIITLPASMPGRVQAKYDDVLQFQLPSDNNYTAFHLALSPLLGSVSLADFSSLDADSMLDHLTTSLLDTCKKLYLKPHVPPSRLARKNRFPPNIVQALKSKETSQGRNF